MKGVNSFESARDWRVRALLRGNPNRCERFFSLYNGLAVYLSLWILFHLFSVVMFVKPPSVGLINFQFEHFSFQTFDRELVHLGTYTARTGFGKSWIVLEISECIFRALGSFGKLVVAQLGYGKVNEFF